MGTEPDIYVDEVLENLARISNDPVAMPYFTLLNNGVPSVADKATLNFGFLTFPAQSVVKQLHRQRGGQIGPLGAERDVGGNWTLSPVNDPDRLTAMRYLYLWVLGRPLQNPIEAETLLKQYIGTDFQLANVPQSWFRYGRWHDVPKESCRSFHHHGTYYWIVPGMEEHLTKLTITMLDIATIAPKSTPKPTQTVVWRINPLTNEPIEIVVTRVLEYSSNQTPSNIPNSPINLVKLPQQAAQIAPTAPEAMPYLAPPAGESMTPLKDRYNNYSNPIVSPGLFSQPRS